MVLAHVQLQLQYKCYKITENDSRGVRLILFYCNAEPRVIAILQLRNALVRTANPVTVSI